MNFSPDQGDKFFGWLSEWDTEYSCHLTLCVFSDFCDDQQSSNLYTLQFISPSKSLNSYIEVCLCVIS